MADTVLYVYAVTREPVVPRGEAVDQTNRFGTASAAGVSATFTPVAREEFSQEVIDRRAGDLEWLGAIGYRHQEVMTELMAATDVVPLRAFSMFTSEDALREYLAQNRDALLALLDRVRGKREWTFRIEFDPVRWSDALVSRVDSLRELASEAESASEGKSYLLRKKLDEEKKRASREAEQQVVTEIERALVDRLRCEAIPERRQQREGAFPQIHVLIDRDEESRLEEVRDELTGRYGAEGITVAMTGPWPPYTFAKTS